MEDDAIMSAAKTGRLATILALAAGLAGCANETISGLMVKPGKYANYTCEEMAMVGGGFAKRERELQALMDKAAQGAGGEVAIAIAYKSEFLSTQGHLRELEAAAVAKDCKISWRSLSEGAVQ